LVIPQKIPAGNGESLKSHRIFSRKPVLNTLSILKRDMTKTLEPANVETGPILIAPPDETLPEESWIISVTPEKWRYVQAAVWAACMPCCTSVNISRVSRLLVLERLTVSQSALRAGFRRADDRTVIRRNGGEALSAAPLTTNTRYSRPISKTRYAVLTCTAKLQNSTGPETLRLPPGIIKVWADNGYGRAEFLAAELGKSLNAGTGEY
jgi:hypothetical protein